MWLVVVATDDFKHGRGVVWVPIECGRSAESPLIVHRGRKPRDGVLRTLERHRLGVAAVPVVRHRIDGFGRLHVAEIRDGKVGIFISSGVKIEPLTGRPGYLHRKVAIKSLRS